MCVAPIFLYFIPYLLASLPSTLHLYCVKAQLRVCAFFSYTTNITKYLCIYRTHHIICSFLLLHHQVGWRHGDKEAEKNKILGEELLWICLFKLEYQAMLEWIGIYWIYWRHNMLGISARVLNKSWIGISL
jgi:hypothetical protein